MGFWSEFNGRPLRRAWRLVCATLGTFALVSGSAGAELTGHGQEFFETKIRPVLSLHCSPCHDPAKGKVKGGLELDWKGGWEKGGDSGPAIVPGNPESSLLIRAIQYRDPDLQMPPEGKRLSASQVADLTAWVKMGAPDPRLTRSEAVAQAPVDAKNHWGFKPVAKPQPPAVRNEAWVQNDIDRFILVTQEANGLSPNPPADKRTLLRRVHFDLIGLPPSSEKVQAFVDDTSPLAFEKVVNELLSSPQYGERWARHWLDVARYADTKGQVNRQRESLVYPYAWTYRDYVIDSFNEDKPYDRFILEQLAADRLPLGTNRMALAALGFLTLGDRFNGNPHEIINDRIDVTTKAFLGLTVACARCHDHKFDPIPQADYYALHGIFASSVEPLLKPEISAPQTPREHRDYLAWRTQIDARLAQARTQAVAVAFGDYRRLAGVYLYATRMPERQREEYVTRMGGQTNVLRAWQQVTRLRSRQMASIFGPWNALARIPEERFAAQARRLVNNTRNSELSRDWHPFVLRALQAAPPRTLSEAASVYGALFASNDAGWQTALAAILGEAALRVLPPRQRGQLIALREQSDWLEMVHPGAPARAPVLTDGPAPKDSPIFIRGEAENRGAIAPRRFLEVLGGPNRPVVKTGSGRLELAQAIASRSNPLTARVMVNRVWLHHFGEGLVGSPDDFGCQASAPSHPELLDYLAARFMEEGWSLKKLHKLILHSATYQQSSDSNAAAAQKDPFNRWLARANIRRLEFEPLRDSILYFGGKLDLTVGGHPVDLSEGQGRSRARANRMMNRIPEFRLAAGKRRTIYGYVDRADLMEEFNIFDVPNPSAPIGKRHETIAPQQALFLMNSPLVVEQVRRVVQRPEFRAQESDRARVNFLYQLYFQRRPQEAEIDAGLYFVQQHKQAVADGAPVRARGLNAWEAYAHALLLTNEAAFVK